MTGVFTGIKNRDPDTQREHHVTNKGRDWNDVSSIRKTRISCNLQKDESRKALPLEASEGAWSYLISDFWPQTLWDNRFLWFEVTQFVATCHGSPRRLTHEFTVLFSRRTYILEKAANLFFLSPSIFLI